MNSHTYSLRNFYNPRVLNWLVGGQLKSSFKRAVRFGFILNYLYNSASTPNHTLPDPWRYPDLRDKLFDSNHPRSDESDANLILKCEHPDCICHRTARSLLNPKAVWYEEINVVAGFTRAELDTELGKYPFATVHRSIREDLKVLEQRGWLQRLTQGQYRCLPVAKLPTLPQEFISSSEYALFEELSSQQILEFHRAIETLAEVMPSLEMMLEPLGQKLDRLTHRHRVSSAPVQRIFIHFDYILSEDEQSRVDDYQDRLEELWQEPEGGVVQFDYLYATPGSPPDRRKVVVYPVCLHYIRRAKYLSAYGKDPEGNITWHNYRLDRIASFQLKVLAWGDRNIPKQLKEMRRTGTLPTPKEVSIELQKAWGFKFYSEPQLLILRFPPDFARWYVNNTRRHDTFKPIAYQDIAMLMCQSMVADAERQQVMAILAQRSPQDVYYQAQVRPDDINIIQRLRDWRPKGEVIAPLALREQMLQEAREELANYTNI